MRSSGLEDSQQNNKQETAPDATPVTPSQSLNTHFIVSNNDQNEDTEEHQQDSPVTTSSQPSASIFASPFKYFTRNTKHERTSSLDAIISPIQREEQQDHDEIHLEITSDNNTQQSKQPETSSTTNNEKNSTPSFAQHQRLQSSDYAYNSDNIILTTSNYNSSSINSLVKKFFTPSTSNSNNSPAPSNPTSPSLGRRISQAIKRLTVGSSTSTVIAPGNPNTTSQPISSMINNLAQSQQPQGQNPPLERISLDNTATLEPNPKNLHPHSKHKIPRSYKALFKETIYKRLYIAAIVGNLVMAFVFLFLTVFFAVYEKATLWYLLIVFAALLVVFIIGAIIFTVMLVRNVWREKRRRRKKMMREKIVEEIILENKAPQNSNASATNVIANSMK